MRTRIYTCIALFSILINYGQVGVGTTDPKATLDITASNIGTPSNEDGILIPRINNFPTTNPGADQDGMMVFVTGNGTPSKGFYYWDDNSNLWISIQTAINSLAEGDDIDINASQIDIEPVLDNVHTINSPTNNLLMTVPNSSSRVQFSTGGNQFFNVGPSITENIGIGVNNGADNTDRGLYNTFIGYNAGQNTTSTTGTSAQGSLNQAIGALALSSNTTGVSNVAIGYNALGDNVTGNANIAIGTQALFRATAANNIAIGVSSGYNTTTGSNNIFLGSTAGFNETGSNKLYIENSNANTDNALIYGEFDNDILRTNGQLQIGNPTTTGYALPETDGANGQVMTTDGAGVVTFQDLPTFTDTDEQDLSSSVVTANEEVEIAITNGTNTTINIQDADANSSNEIITAASLNGTDLEITEAGSTTIVNLSGLQDGNTQNTLDQAYDEGGAGAGNTITADNGALTINGTGDGGITVRSINFGNGTDMAAIPNAQVLMFFNPKTGAFRTGQSISTNWSQANLGDLSFAQGHGTVASGGRSFAVNSGTEATATNSFAAGIGNTASGDASAAFGAANTAFSAREFVIGSYSTNYTPDSTIGHDLDDRAFTIGNGFNNTARSNALIIYKNGTMNINDAYNMPTADGVTGQVMTTDGAGVVTFEDLPVDTDTDEQDLSSSVVTANEEVQISITNGTNTTINIQDADADTDNEIITAATLNGTDLEITEAGSTTTVDLSSLNPVKSVARILMSTSQTNTGAGTTKVNFDNVDFDINGNFNTTADVFTVPANGLYRVTTQVTADNSTGTGIFSVRIRVNGGQVRRAEFNHNGNGQVVRQITSVLNLTAGQTIDVAFARPAIGATILANGGLTFFEIEQL